MELLVEINRYSLDFASKSEGLRVGGLPSVGELNKFVLLNDFKY